MPRPRRRKRFAVSLFPFLSVLACVIGVLTLLITATAVGEIGGGAVDLETYERLEDEIASGRRRLAELRALSDEVTSLGVDLSEARATSERLRAEREALGDVAVASAPLRAELRDGEERVAGLEAELARVKASRAEAEERLAERRRALASAPLRLRASGSGTGIEPYFAECRRDGVVLYEGVERRPLHVSSPNIEKSLDVRAFFRRVRAHSTASAILLVRPSGVSACRALQHQAVLHNARSGSMPIPEDGELDFSAVGGEG